ncbi:hypothetical protein BC833DRAFT_575850, partial [Globomyces pollinis-pini]
MGCSASTFRSKITPMDKEEVWLYPVDLMMEPPVKDGIIQPFLEDPIVYKGRLYYWHHGCFWTKPRTHIWFTSEDFSQWYSERYHSSYISVYAGPHLKSIAAVNVRNGLGGKSLIEVVSKTEKDYCETTLNSREEITKINSKDKSVDSTDYTFYFHHGAYWNQPDTHPYFQQDMFLNWFSTIQSIVIEKSLSADSPIVKVDESGELEVQDKAFLLAQRNSIRKSLVTIEEDPEIQKRSFTECDANLDILNSKQDKNTTVYTDNPHGENISPEVTEKNQGSAPIQFIETSSIVPDTLSAGLPSTEDGDKSMDQRGPSELASTNIAIHTALDRMNDNNWSKEDANVLSQDAILNTGPTLHLDPAELYAETDKIQPISDHLTTGMSNKDVYPIENRNLENSEVPIEVLKSDIERNESGRVYGMTLTYSQHTSQFTTATASEISLFKEILKCYSAVEGSVSYDSEINGTKMAENQLPFIDLPIEFGVISMTMKALRVEEFDLPKEFFLQENKNIELMRESITSDVRESETHPSVKLEMGDNVDLVEANQNISKSVIDPVHQEENKDPSTAAKDVIHSGLNEAGKAIASDEKKVEELIILPGKSLEKDIQPINATKETISMATQAMLMMEEVLRKKPKIPDNIKLYTLEDEETFNLLEKVSEVLAAIAKLTQEEQDRWRFGTIYEVVSPTITSANFPLINEMQKLAIDKPVLANQISNVKLDRKGKLQPL